MKNIIFYLLLLMIFSCHKDEENSLSVYLEQNSELMQESLIACAVGGPSGIFGDPSSPTSVIYYPINGATDVRYFEAPQVKDSLDFEKYVQLDLTTSSLFNGYLMHFNHMPFEGERMGIVTYEVGNNLHISDPIRLKTNTKPTEVNANLASIDENKLNPSFSWEDGDIDENVIYFQLISDLDNNFISGTYTTDPAFTFYDTQNVVLDINAGITPLLEPDSEYIFSLMGVSEDNWVNMFVQKTFATD